MKKEVIHDQESIKAFYCSRHSKMTSREEGEVLPKKNMITPDKFLTGGGVI